MRNLLVKASLHVLTLKLELVLQVVKLLCGFFLADNRLPLARLNTFEHTVVVSLLLLALVALLLQLHGQELHLLVVDGLVLFKL